MPGRGLNTEERRLLELWESPAWKQQLQLRSIEIIGETGLRGINRLFIPFRYPISAICGNNGSGKSTILALAALAHHTPTGWYVYWGNIGRRRARGDRTYYRFSDFFVHSRRREGAIENVSVTWRYIKNEIETIVTFKKKEKKWGQNYARRPERAIDFLSLARILPAHEMRSLRSIFCNPSGDIPHSALDTRSRHYLSSIMGKEYNTAEVQNKNNYTFQNCQTDVTYTAFNMGGGESCMIVLLYLLQKMARGGLLVVEEIDAGLHPQAQVRLTQVLIRICREKQIQLICSTHSEIFLDSLPRQARILIRRSGNEHSVFEAPSTRFAMYEMTGVTQPELQIYCEDMVAAILIEEALPQDLRLRVRICDIGSNQTVIRQGVSHLRSGYEMKALCVLDGDCTNAEVEGWIVSEQADRDVTPEFLILPGDNLPPEKWVLEQLRVADYQREFANQLSCSVPEARTHLEALCVEIDHHNINHTLHQRTNLDEKDCLHRTMRAVAPRHPQLDELREKVSVLLN